MADAPMLIVLGIVLPCITFGISIGVFIAGDQAKDTVKIFGFIATFSSLWMMAGLLITLIKM